MKDLYTEIYKVLMKEIEDTNKWKDILPSWIAKMSILPKAMNNSMQSLSKFQWHFPQNRTNNTKTCMEPQRP